MAEKRDSIETVTKICSDFETKKEELSLLLKELDDKHFRGAFTQKKVTLTWSSNMKETKSRVIKPKAGKPGTILLSSIKLSANSKDELIKFVRLLLDKAYKDFGFQDNSDDTSVCNSNDSSDSCAGLSADSCAGLLADSCAGLSADNLEKELQNLSIDEKPIKSKVRFQMDDKIREIELQDIVDQRLEELDPHPDIQILFKEYDNRFFKGILNRHNVELSWGDKLTSCAGVTYDQEETNDRPIQIRLSRKLLEHEKRSQLVETLLHEMIHAYTFIERLDYDERNTHGTNFHRIMRGINMESGANIEVCHELIFDDKQYTKRLQIHREKNWKNPKDNNLDEE